MGKNGSSSMKNADLKSTKLSPIYTCKICNLKLESRFACLDHWKSKHGGSEKSHHKFVESSSSTLDQKTDSSASEEKSTKLKEIQTISISEIMEFVTKEVVLVHGKPKRKCICPLCDQSFISRDTLKRHITTVHNLQRPYVCSPCKMGFIQRHAWIRHRKSCDVQGEAIECRQV